MSSVGEDFPLQQERVRKLWGAAAVQCGMRWKRAVKLDDVLARAAAAQSSGDLVRILAAYGELKAVR